MLPNFRGLVSTLVKGKIDYTVAKATPTICFGCTNHCGVIGWVQDGRVRKIEGNPLDPNSQGNYCSKAQGMISKMIGAKVAKRIFYEVTT